MEDHPRHLTRWDGLLEILTQRQSEVVEAWMKKVRADGRMSSAEGLDEFLLRDHIPAILSQLAQAIDRHRSGRESKDSAAAMVAASGAVKAHSEIRHIQGYKLSEALRELSHLRSTIVDLWWDSVVVFDRSEMDVFHRALDETMTAASTNMASLSVKGTEEFLAILAHELRTPLSVIVAYLEVLSRAEQGSKKMHEVVVVLERNASLMNRIIEDLMDVTRVTRGEFSVEPESCDANEVLQTAFQSAKRSFEKKGIRFELENQAECGSIVCDSARIAQVLSNLLSNALKFTPPGGTVKLRSALQEPNLVFEVTDTGEGIAPNRLPEIFEKQKLESRGEHKGLGIGLGISRKIVELHGGKMSIESSGEGRGTTIRVALPVAAPVEPVSRAGRLRPAQ